jgi:very-short-patch-repair endonuclease
MFPDIYVSADEFDADDHVDLAFPQWRIAIEYEGDHHRERTQFRRDITRGNALLKAGWLVLRFTADDIVNRPQQLIDQVLTTIRARRPVPPQTDLKPHGE